jgi:hypothetical protein
MGEFMDEMNARNDEDYLTKEDKEAISKLPKSVFDFMALPKSHFRSKSNKPLKGVE